MSGYRYRFSVITISFNAERVIQKTINSVINQNYFDMEYIFVDGGSMDLTNNIIKKNREKLKTIGINSKHISEKDKGISDAFNKGIQLAEGEIICLLNTDDELIDGALKIIDHEMNSDIDIVYGNCIWVDSAHNIQYIRKSKRDLSNLMYQMDIIHPATFVKKEMYDRYGMFDISYKYCMDEELLVRMLQGGAKFKYVDHEFTIFKAGGISDRNIWSVILEGTRIPLKYNKPKIYVMLKARIKFGRHQLAHLYRFKIKK